MKIQYITTIAAVSTLVEVGAMAQDIKFDASMELPESQGVDSQI